jgi:hypothetical protein
LDEIVIVLDPRRWLNWKDNEKERRFFSSNLETYSEEGTF